MATYEGMAAIVGIVRDYDLAFAPGYRESVPKTEGIISPPEPAPTPLCASELPRVNLIPRRRLFADAAHASRDDGDREAPRRVSIACTAVDPCTVSNAESLLIYRRDRAQEATVRRGSRPDRQPPVGRPAQRL